MRTTPRFPNSVNRYFVIALTLSGIASLVLAWIRAAGTESVMVADTASTIASIANPF